MNRRQFGISTIVALLSTKLKSNCVPALALPSEFVISPNMAEKLGLYDRGILSRETIITGYRWIPIPTSSNKI